MCKDGITDSSKYLCEAMSRLDNIKIEHVSISIEALKPKFSNKINDIRDNLSKILNLDKKHIGITATSGEGLTSFGKGEGIFVTSIISFSSFE